jgi:hypothetical protein
MMEGALDHFIKVDRLPEGFEFPPELRDRFHFDPTTGKLTFHGYMSKAEFDRVSQLTSDWKFRRALEELFRQCIPDEKPRPRGVRRVLSAFGRLFSAG